LLLKLLHFSHHILSFINHSLFSQFLSILVIDINLLLDLVDFLDSLLLLGVAHLRTATFFVVSVMLDLGLRAVLSTSQTSFNLVVDLSDHNLQLRN